MMRAVAVDSSPSIPARIDRRGPRGERDIGRRAETVRSVRGVVIRVRRSKRCSKV